MWIMTLHTLQKLEPVSLATQNLKMDILLPHTKKKPSLLDTKFLLKQLYWSNGLKMSPLKSVSMMAV